MGHGVSTDAAVTAATLDAGAIEGVAATLHALGTPSRLRILLRLRDAACSVGELAVAIEMEQSAVSHQLRVLRHLGLVAGTRDGKHIRYRLYDDHVAQLLDEAIYHAEHVRMAGRASRDSDAAVPVEA